MHESGETKGVRVNALRPGFFPTEWNKKTLLIKKEKANSSTYTYEKVCENGHELIGAVLWLSSDSASFVTGTERTVDGGFSCMTI